MPQIFYEETTSSTNDSAAEKYNPEDICCVYTFNQTSGRGQYGNTWLTEPGKNLAVSFCVPKNFITETEVLFNYHTAICVRTFIANMTAGCVFIKWPNDIILNDKKVCGILIEARKNFYVVGIGINIQQEKFEKISNAGSILTQTGKILDVREFAEKFIKFFCEEIIKPSQTLDEYNLHLYKKGIVSVFEDHIGRQNGIITSADDEGFLHIRMENSGEQKYRMKEIKMLY